MNFLTHLRACSLNSENSPPTANQTVQDLPTKVGRSLRPAGCPKKFIMPAQRSYAKASSFEASDTSALGPVAVMARESAQITIYPFILKEILIKSAEGYKMVIKVRNILAIVLLLVLGISIQAANANTYRHLYIFCSYQDAQDAWQAASGEHGAGDGGLLYYFGLSHIDWHAAGYTYDEGTWVDNVDMYAYPITDPARETCSDWNLLNRSKMEGASKPGADSTKKGEPIDIATGNEYRRETDLRLIGPGLPMTFARYYNSQSNVNEPFGYGWTTTFSDHLTQETGKVILRQADGAHVHFADDGNGKYISETGIQRIIEPSDGGFVLTEPDGKRLTFDATGKLTQVTGRNGNTQTLSYSAGRLSSAEGNFGRRIDLAYNAQGRLETLTTPVGVFTYTYDGTGNLTRVDQPAGTHRIYQYTDPYDAHNLTGIINEKGIQAWTYTYDSQDRALSVEGADGAYGIQVNYDFNYLRSVTDSRGNTIIYRITIRNGIARVKTSYGSGCSSCWNEFTHNDKLWIVESKDAKDTTTLYTHDSRGNVLTKTEAAGTSQERTTTHTYHPDYSLVTSITTESVANPGQNTLVTLNYDTAGNLLSRTRTGYTGGNQETRTSTFTYNAFGQMTSADGPRTDVDDVTTYEYYPNDASQGLNRGMLKKITDPLGEELQFSNYNAFGKPATVTDISGIATTFVYDTEGRVTSKTREGRTTGFEYDDAGNLTKIDQPGTNDIVYTYTDANRLEKMEDSLGNYIQYTYDTEGNHTRQEIHDDSGTLAQFADFEFDEFNRLQKTTYPGGAFEELAYDENNNLINRIDPNSKSTQYDYDFLNRLTTVTQPGSVVTGYGYDSHNNLVSFTDAENHTTAYGYDDFGRQFSAASPDTGTTTYTYDAAGNLISKTDANGITVTYTYDVLNRLIAIHYPDASQDISYTYDVGPNGKGRLTGMTDPSGSYTYSYDVHGNLVTEEKTIEGVTYTTGYAYDATGILTSITYPDGSVVTYNLDDAGRVISVTTTKGGDTKTVAENISYMPFGPITSLIYGNGTVISKTFDQRYWLTAMSAGNVQHLTYTIGAAGNITAITDDLDATGSQTFGYDDLYRLTSATGIYGTVGYTYDKVGNRLTKTIDGATDTYTYTSGTNRLNDITGANPQSFSYDANGNITAMGTRTLAHNQNNRLIQVVENTTTLGTYTHNGNGQRIKKASADGTTIYHYDRFGNLIGESTPSGDFLADYVYLNNMRLAAIPGGGPKEITVSMIRDKGGVLSGVPVYAFTEGGSYTGKSATTDENGVARFDLSDFSDGNYKIRADYLSYQFWSDVITVPGTYSTTIQIAEEATTVSGTQAGAPKQGVKVYLFNASDSYLGQYETTDENGEVSFDLPAGKDFRFRADILGSQFFSETITIVAGGPNDYGIDSGGGILSVTVDQGEGTPIPDIKVYLFNAGGSYLGMWDQADASGLVTFDVCSGDYKVRADYMGYQFWSEQISVSSDATYTLAIHHQDTLITVQGDNNGNVEPREGLKVYLFTAAGSYLGRYEVTDANGQVFFDLPGQDYKFRTDYLSQQYWSQVINWTDDVITINEGTADVTVTNAGLPVEGVNVYVFNNAGSYLNIHDVTDANGQASFRLPAGDYSFRADYMANQYWSGTTSLIADVSNPVEISTGGGSFALTVLKGADDPLVGVQCYLFNATGSYLGDYQVTNDQGEVGFNLADGSYKIRADYMGYQFWTQVFDMPTTLALTHTISHQDVTVTVNGDYGGDVHPFSGLKVYLFTPLGSYLGKYDVTDANGQVTFKLPEQDYKVRADYLSQQYWSAVFCATDETIAIKEGMAEVHVTQGASPLENVNVYVFNAAGAYLNLYGQTDANGVASFRLPEGTYKFRADHGGSQYWATKPVNAHEVNVVNLNTGGGTFTLTVEKEAGVPMTNIPVYVFTAGGSYLGLSGQTAAQGQVSFDLSDGDYKFRADYLGYRFWSNVSTVPTMLSDVLTIAHRDVTITVESLYQSPGEPIEGVRVYLFKESGSYMGLYANTNAEGKVVFSLPQESYKVRADYMGYQFWSEPFVWADTYVTIDHGLAVIHVSNSSGDVVDAPVYLFKASGSYLGKYERTDAVGEAEFLLPDQQYKLRVDYEGTQYWSDVISVIPHEENNIELDLDLLALDLTNDPKPDRFDGVPPEYKPEKVMVASLGSLTGLLTQAVISQIPGETVYYYINDHLGTPQKIVDENGVVVWSADYKPFGEADVTVTTIESNFRFPGQYCDRETGLHYNYFRYYNPQIGRYLTPDPLGGLTYGENLYAYVKNNPILLIDPWGLCTQNTFWGTVETIGSGILQAGVQGVQGAMYSTGRAAGDISDLAVHGDPFVKTILGVATVTTAGPLTVAGAMEAGPAVIAAVLVNPGAVQNAADFVQGFVPSTAPPPSFAGFMGFEAGRLFERIMNR